MAGTVGLDIGSSAVRAVEVRGRSGKVVKAGRIALAPGVVENGQIRQPAEVTKALRRLWQENKFSTSAVRLGVGSGSVLVRQIELDWMPPADLRKAMRYLVADLLPVPVDQANIDHVVLEEVERPDTSVDALEGATKRMIRVLLVATARDGVDEIVRCVQAAGLRPTTADLSPLALVRTAARELARAKVDSGHATEAILDVGADKVAVAVHTLGRPRFVRVISGVGGGFLTRAVHEANGGELTLAEETKRSSHVAAAGSNTAGSVDQTPTVLREAAQHVLDEVRDTLQFFAASDPDHLPTCVAITGLGATVPGFAELCAQVLGLPVRQLGATLTPPVTRRGAPDHLPAELAVSVGLCLGATA